MHSEYTLNILTNRRRDMTLNVITRLRNALIKGINTQGVIPKWVIVWTEADLIDDTKDSKLCDVGYVFGRLIDWLMKQMRLTMQQAIDKGYPSAKTTTTPSGENAKVKFPYFLWILPVDHDNMSPKNKELRQKFSKALVSTAKLHNELIVLPLKQKWMQNDIELFDKTKQILTTKGAMNIWKSLDRTLKYADTIVQKNTERPLHDLFYQQKRTLFSFHDFFQPGKKYTAPARWGNKTSNKLEYINRCARNLQPSQYN